jgi:hypothetical protein
LLNHSLCDTLAPVSGGGGGARPPPLSQDNWPAGQELNLRPSKYKAEVLTIQHLVSSKNLED